jgi:Fe-S cluster biogenesis protein NfuA
MSETGALLDPPVQAVYEELREILRIDGADLLVREVTPSSIGFDLELQGAECLECVMPRDLLEEIFMSRLQEVDPGIMKVEINDPRDAG